MGRLGGWVVAAATAGLVLCAPAQAVLPPPGLEVGGGGPYAGKGTTITLVSARVGPDGRTVRITGTGFGKCKGTDGALRRFTTEVTLADDGTFAASGLKTTTVYASTAATGKADVSGTFDGVTATGAIRIHDVRTRRGKQRRCRDSTGTFTLRDPGQPTGPATPAPAPATALYGLTDRRVDGLRGGVFATVSKNGRTFKNFSIEVGMTCGGGDIFPQFTPVKRLKADGSFETRERFPVFFANVIERWRARTRGGFLPGGALSGRFDATMKRRYTEGPRKGRRYVCDPAASIRFWAIP